MLAYRAGKVLGSGCKFGLYYSKVMVSFVVTHMGQAYTIPKNQTPTLKIRYVYSSWKSLVMPRRTYEGRNNSRAGFWTGVREEVCGPPVCFTKIMLANCYVHKLTFK